MLCVITAPELDNLVIEKSADGHQHIWFGNVAGILHLVHFDNISSNGFLRKTLCIEEWRKMGNRLMFSTHQAVAVAQLHWNCSSAVLVDGNLSITRLSGGSVTEMFFLHTFWGEDMSISYRLYQGQSHLQMPQWSLGRGGFLARPQEWWQHLYREEEKGTGIGRKMYMGVLIDFNEQIRK